MTTRASTFTVVGVLLCAVSGFGQTDQSVSAEVMAARQLESGLAFAREGSYSEALKDFQAVVEMYPTSTAADNALLEIARYHLDEANVPPRALAMLERLLEEYPLSDSAAEAHLLAGRVAMAQGGTEDFDRALASFQRVSRLFPDAAVVPQARYFSAEIARLMRREQEALDRYRRLAVDYTRNRWAVHARLRMGATLVAMNEPIAAMEELQQVRNGWPDSPEADLALAGLTTLYRLYLRDRSAPVYRSASPAARSGARLPRVLALQATPDDAVYYLTESAAGLMTSSSNAARPPRVAKPRSLTLSQSGAVVVVGQESVQPGDSAAPLTLSVPQPGRDPKVLKKIEDVVSLSNGDWIVADEDERAIHHFTESGSYLAAFAPIRARKLAVNRRDGVAALDRDRRTVTVLDRSGTVRGRLELRDRALDIRNPVDLSYDDFGHLYLLDREGLYIFDHQLALLARVESENRLAPIERATAVTVDSFGRLYIADDKAKQVFRFQ